MVRTRDAGARLDQLTRSALRVFLRFGFAAARMADVAADAGVSQGLLYNYVESKEALLHLVVERILDGDLPATPTLPIPTPAPGATRALMEKGMHDGLALPSLGAALRRPAPDDPVAELAAILTEHYRAVFRWRHLLALTERVAKETPQVRAQFYEGTRRPFVSRFGDYLRRRIGEGVFVSVPDPAVAARLMIESVAWFANHRFGDADSADIDDDVAETTVVQMLTRAMQP